jgi:hypothetical protein
MAALAVWYCLSSFAFWFYGRYLVPLALPGIVLAAGLIAPRLQRRPALSLALPLLVAPVLAATILGWQGRGFYGTINFREQAVLVAEEVPAGEWVAAGQSGTLGFVRSHVLNMDGKVNPEVHGWRDRPWEYLRARNIRWFADWEWYVWRSLGPEPERNGWRKVAERDNFLLYRYEGDD